MKYVYLVERGQLSSLNNQYFFYDVEVYSSLKKALHSAYNSIEVNKGYEIKDTEDFHLPSEIKRILYKCLDCEGVREMELMIVIKQKILR